MQSCRLIQAEASMKAEIQRIKGSKDLLGDDFVAIGAIQETLQAFLASYGYVGIDTPLLEETRLFLRKSGGEVASKMYTFTDPGGHMISLRPEFTASVIRTYLENDAALSLPVRWQYTGPVFRYEQPELSEYRQSTQQGVELIGSASPLADVEMLTLACRGIQKLGVEGHRLVLGHIGAVLKLLSDFGLSDRVKLFLISSMGELSKDPQATRRVGEQLEEQGLAVGPGNRQQLGTFLGDLDEKEATEIVQELLMGASEPAGSREVDEIISRFLRKLREADEPERVEKGLAFCAHLSQVKGKPEEALEGARRLALQHDLDPAPLHELTELLALLAESDLGGTQVVIDFGLARGLAYYTGMVFEINHQLLPGDLPLCGGGRYDGLVRALGGGKDVASLGFAYNLERLRQAQEAERKTTAQDATSAHVLVVLASPSAYGSALKTAESLRQRGQRVEMDVDQRTLEANIDYAESRGIPEVILVRDDGQTDKYSVSGRNGNGGRE